MGVKMWAWAAVLLGLAGCTQYHEPSDDQRSLSFQPFQEMRIGGAGAGGEALSDYARLRTAIVIRGQLPLRALAGTGRVITVHLGTIGDTEIDGPSHAVALTQDGYFLTAAHVVKGGMSGLVYWDGQSAQLGYPRVVAMKWDPPHGADIAIVHVDARVPFVFEWEPEEAIHEGDRVAAVGCVKPNVFRDEVLYWRDSCMGGKIQRVDEVAGGGLKVWSDLPLRPGDSGGPLVAADGRLVGINSQVRVDVTRPTLGGTYRPDVGWVESAIRADRTHPGPSPRGLPYKEGPSPLRFVISL